MSLVRLSPAYRERVVMEDMVKRGDWERAMRKREYKSMVSSHRIRRLTEEIEELEREQSRRQQERRDAAFEEVMAGLRKSWAAMNKCTAVSQDRVAEWQKTLNAIELHEASAAKQVMDLRRTIEAVADVLEGAAANLRKAFPVPDLEMRLRVMRTKPRSRFNLLNQREFLDRLPVGPSPVPLWALRETEAEPGANDKRASDWLSRPAPIQGGLDEWSSALPARELASPAAVRSLREQIEAALGADDTRASGWVSRLAVIGDADEWISAQTARKVADEIEEHAKTVRSDVEDVSAALEELASSWRQYLAARAR